MIPSLSRFDSITAAGILARMALAIDDEANPASAPSLPGEQVLRVQVLSEVCRAVGLTPEDQSESALDTITSFLDHESDQLSSIGDSKSILAKLGNKGELPSDLFEPSINLEVARFYGARYLGEEVRIKETVKRPDREQHFGEPKGDGQPFLISLFAKHFKDQKYSGRNFTLLVAGQRSDQTLSVIQVWRLYDDIIDSSGNGDLIELLKRFSEEFGVTVDINGEKAKFVLFSGAGVSMDEIQTTWEIKGSSNGSKPEVFSANITHFVQKDPGTDKICGALIVAVDVIKYERLLDSKKW